MTATDELRRMLDERGVVWGTGFGDDTLWAGRHGIEWRWDKQEGVLAMWTHAITPEQAIEATLGPRVQPPTMPEQPPYDLLIDLLRDEWDIEVMWDGLRRFWYVGLTEEGVRKRDEREATLGRGTCRDIALEGEWFECSECRTVKQLIHPHYCPNCGAKVVDDGSVD